MGDELYQSTEWSMEAQSAFQPSARLRTRLLWACLATIVAGALGFGTVLSNDENLAVALLLATIVPLFVMLRGFLLLAKEVGSIGLRRTCLGTYGMAMLATLSPLLDADWVGDEWISVGATVAMALTAIVLLCVIAHRPAWARMSPEAAGEAQKKASWGGGLGFFLLVKFFLLSRVLKPLLGAGLDLNFLIVVVLGGLVVLWGLFQFIGGIVKMRLTGRLGMTSAVLGLIEIVVTLVLAGLAVTVILALLDATENAGPKEEDVEAAVTAVWQRWAPTGTAIALSCHAALTLMTLLFFWTIRGAADPEEVLSLEW